VTAADAAGSRAAAARATRWIGPAVLAVMMTAFTAAAMAQPDPTAAVGAFRPGDRRAHRYGTLDYAQVAALVAGLRDQREAATGPEERAVLSVKLADVYVAREMLPEALRELDEARRLAPDEPEVLWRLAVVRHYMGDDAAAQEALALAEGRAPGDPRVQKAATLVRGE
jgi:hypothetical protein